MIDSKVAAAKINKERYAESMERAFKNHALVRTDYRDLKVTVVDPTHATVAATTYATPRGRAPFNVVNEWKLEKRDGRWLVVERSDKWAAQRGSGWNSP